MNPGELLVWWNDNQLSALNQQAQGLSNDFAFRDPHEAKGYLPQRQGLTTGPLTPRAWLDRRVEEMRVRL